MPTPLPLRIRRPLNHQCLFQRPLTRHFSAKSTQTPNPKAAREQAEKSLGKAPSTLAAEMRENRDGLPNDIGLFPGTFIRLPWRKLPSLFSTPKERLWYEWKYVKTKGSDLYQRLYYKFWFRTGKPRPKLANSTLIPLAKEYHEAMYKAFAKRDEKSLSNLCLDRLHTHFRTLLAGRPKNKHLSWQLLSYLSKPRIVSNRMAPLPIEGFKETGLRQVVVRLHTRQLLTTRTEPRISKKQYKELAWTPDGVQPEEVKDEVEEKEENVVEYVVLQRRMVRGQEEDWLVWGFADETTTEKIREDEEFERLLSKYNAEHPAQESY
ncbi:hypothetical protein K469DRAFT_35077 [Zopfia rhizophila CBS 207.26]|uniref:Tim44-like domain-containing protein n=1 Tax=Zopfia rhizophila CBS 207.26 TaxID=1314779 RepID=A0A6A6DDT5_9PEZI|nr:hypothetical protein K469DRAFT_35077 [Zopfia rhizophila CBS 207.26]